MSVRRAGCTPVLLPKAHTATKLTMQVRIPPPAPQASHFTGRGVRGRERKKGEPLPRRLTRPRRPIPLYGTFSTEDWALAAAREAERHAAEVARRCGRWAGSARLRRASRSKTADRCPLNWVVKFKRRPERRRVGRLPGFGLQYALMHDVRAIAVCGFPPIVVSM